jgi:methionine-rich copper-binding protein CopC
VKLFGMARGGLLGLLVAAMIGVGAVPASAHTALKSSDPEKGAEVAPPTEITLTYTQSVRLPRVVLTGEDGKRHESGSAQVSGDTVTQAVNGTLPNGTYTVGWRVVSADGHPVSGKFEFTVKGSSASTAAPSESPAPGAGAAGTTGAPSTAASPAAGQEQDSGGSSGWLWIGLGAVVIALGVGGVIWARRPTED